jgi:hypothetical protein
MSKRFRGEALPSPANSAATARTCFKTPIRREAKETGPHARPQAPNNRRRIRWNTLRIVRVPRTTQAVLHRAP